MKNKKILFFTNGLPLGGGEKVMVSIMNYLAGKGFGIILVTVSLTGSGFKSLDQRIKIVDLGVKRIIFSIIPLVLAIRKERPDTVFSSSVHSNVILLLSLFMSGVKSRSVIRVGSPLSVIFSRFDSFRDSKIIPMLSKVLYGRASVVIAVSKGIADDLRDVLRIDGSNISVIYSPKNIKEIIDKSEEYVPGILKDSGPNILFVGRLVTQKDVPTLVNAFKLVRSKRPEARLIIVGDGNIDGLDSEGVVWEGVRDNPYVYMKNSDLLVLPSLWEGLPNVLLEALACQIPVVSTDCLSGGPREILAPRSDHSKRLESGIEKVDSGYLIPPSDPSVMSKAILQALDRSDYIFRCDFFSESLVMKRYLDVL